MCAPARPRIAGLWDRNYRLVGERSQQFDLFFGEGTNCFTTKHDHADGRAFTQQRDAQHCTEVAEPDRLSEGEFGVGCYVRDLNRFAVCNNAPDDRSTPELDRMTLHELVELCWIAVACNLEISRAGFTRYRSGVRLAQLHSGFDKCLKHGLQIECGTTDNFEDVGGCGLLL